MDGGLIVQMGTHAQLLAEPDGLYRRLCARQFGEGEPDLAALPTIPTLRSDPGRGIGSPAAAGPRRWSESAAARTTPVDANDRPVRPARTHRPVFRSQYFKEVADKLNRRENRELPHRVY